MVSPSMCFARSTGRMVRIVEELEDGAVVKAHSKCPSYQRLRSWEKSARWAWPESWIYRPGVSPELDLLERAEWARIYPNSLRFAK